jgi:hypothetical protein
VGGNSRIWYTMCESCTRLKFPGISVCWLGHGFGLENGGFCGFRWGMCVDFFVGDYDRRGMGSIFGFALRGCGECPITAYCGKVDVGGGDRIG